MKGHWAKLAWIVAPLLVVLLLCFLAVPVVFAATSDAVTINATPSYISISLNVSTYDFSTVDADTDEQTPTGHYGIDNTSTVSTDNTVVSNGWQSSGTAWTWGAPGEDTCQMKASDGDGAFDVTIDDATPAALKSSVSADTDWVFELQIDAATSYTHGDAQGTTVTIAASAS